MGVDYSLGLLSLKFWMNRRRSLNFLIFSIDLWVFCVAIEFWVSFIEKLFGHWLRGPFDNTTIAHTLIKGGKFVTLHKSRAFIELPFFKSFWPTSVWMPDIWPSNFDLANCFVRSTYFPLCVFNRCALFSSIQLLDDFRIESAWIRY